MSVGSSGLLDAESRTLSTEPRTVRLDRPEVVAGRFEPSMPEEEYHAHPALSASGMKVLLRSPKHFRAMRALNKARPEFDEGHAAHARVLGVGMPIVEIPTKLLSADGGVRSNTAKKFVEDARAAGKVPLKPPVYARVLRASEAVLGNAKARPLLEKPGWSEVSLFAEDPDTGVQLRMRADRLAEDGTLLDLKTTTDVRPRKLVNAVIDHGYDVSAAVYRHVIRLVLGEMPSPMHLIFVEKEPPYEVRVVRLADPMWQMGGEVKMRAAIDLFAWCQERGEWPGDDEDGGPIHDLPVPAWYERQMSYEEDEL